MPLIYERAFQVRHYECDLYGHLNNAQYLNYMEQVSLEASESLGFDADFYHTRGQNWIIRETEIEYLAPLNYGESVTVKTWVAAVRRAQLLRVHEFRKGSQLAARAHTTWVFLNTETGRPARIPEDIAAGYLPDPETQPAPARPSFPGLAAEPPEAFRVQRRVEWRDVDPQGHVNNAVYLAYADDCGVQVAAAYGWPMERWHAAGFAAVARRHQVRYLQPARLEDELEVATWIAEIGRATAVRAYLIRKAADGAALTQIRTLWTWVDIEKGRPIRVPAGFLQDFAGNMAVETGSQKQ